MAYFSLTYLQSLMEDADRKRSEITLSNPTEVDTQITYLPFKLKLYWPGCIDSPYYHWKAHTYQLKESKSLRKGTLHYHRILRKDGKILKIETYVHSILDSALLMYYEENKRYAFSHPNARSSCANLTQVLTYEDGHVTEDYMIRGNQIVYRQYVHMDGEKYQYYDINYIPSSSLPINWIRIGTITTGVNSKREIDYLWPQSIEANEEGTICQLPELDPGIIEA